MRPSGPTRGLLSATFALAVVALGAHAAAQSAVPTPSAAPRDEAPAPPPQAPRGALGGPSAAPADPAAPTAPAGPAAPAAPADPNALAPAPLGYVALVDAAPLGVDAEAAAFVNGTLRQALTQMGYGVVPTPRMYEAARALALPFPVPPDGLNALLRSLSTPLGVTAELRAGGGYYYATLRVRFTSEPAERVRQLTSTQWTLGDSLRTALSAMLAPPGTAGAGAFTMGAPSPSAMFSGPYGGSSAYVMQPIMPARLPVPAHPQRFEIAGFGLAALGPGSDFFANALFGARGAWFPLDRFGVTASLAYANLRGRAGRVSNVLPMVGVETSIDVMPELKIFLPLRLEAGYLPFNGPVFTATAAASFTLARNVRLEADVLQATLWVLPGSIAISLNLGAQLIVGFGDRGGAPSASPPAPTEGAPVRRRRRRRTQPAAEPASGAEAPANTPAPAPAPAEPAR